jgi:hypothetical protein
MMGKGSSMAKWLDCTISIGQFSGEFAVKGKMYDSTEFSLFAHREDVRFQEEPTSAKPTVAGEIRVSPGPEKDDLMLITLPRPTFENGRTITVKVDQVRDSE